MTKDNNLPKMRPEHLAKYKIKDTKGSDEYLKKIIALDEKYLFDRIMKVKLTQDEYTLFLIEQFNHNIFCIEHSIKDDLLTEENRKEYCLESLNTLKSLITKLEDAVGSSLYEIPVDLLSLLPRNMRSKQ